MRTAATHCASVVPGQVMEAASAVPPSSMMRADAVCGSASAGASTNVSRRIRFMIGVGTPTSAWGCALPLLVPICDAAAVQVVGRQLDLHSVARQDADVVPPHLAGDVA